MRVRNHDHVARYCSPVNVQGGKVIAAAFFPRENEDGISVNWIERYGDDQCAAIREIRRHIELRLKPNGRFAVLDVGKIRRLGLQVQYWPKVWDPSHTLVRGFRSEDTEIAQSLWELIVANGVYLAVK